MAEKDASGEFDFPSPKEMQGWLKHEIADLKRAFDLRVKDATAFVEAYNRGDITRNEAAELSYEYACRWGNILPGGVLRSSDLTDDEVMAQIDENGVKAGLLSKHVLERRNSSKGPSR